MFVCLAQVVHWLVSVVFLQTCLTGGVLTCLRMFVCLAQVAHCPRFGHVYTNMFDRWCADMFGHVCLFGSGGPLSRFGHV